MAKKKIYDRVTTGTARVVEFMTGTSPKYEGLFSELGVDGRNKVNGNKLITIEAKPKGTIIKVDYQSEVTDATITKIWQGLANHYGLVDGPIKGPKIYICLDWNRRGTKK